MVYIVDSLHLNWFNVSYFSSRFLEKSDSGSRSLSQLTDSKSVSGEDDFLVLTSSKTIAEMKDLKKVIRMFKQ